VGCKEEEREGLKATRIEDIWIIISRSEYNRLRPNCIRPRAVENFFFFLLFIIFILAENKIIIKNQKYNLRKSWRGMHRTTDDFGNLAISVGDTRGFQLYVESPKITGICKVHSCYAFRDVRSAQVLHCSINIGTLELNKNLRGNVVKFSG
jgi:hypothetical protein